MQLDASAAREKIEDENDDCENQQKMNPSTQCVAAYEAHNPKNDKNNGDRPKHRSAPYDGWPGRAAIMIGAVSAAFAKVRCGGLC
jgi:hypothetical protein